MGWVEQYMESIKSIKIRDTLHRAITLGMIVAYGLIIWRPSAGDLLNHSFFKNCKGADFIVKNLLQGLPTIEESAAGGEYNDNGFANPCGWNFDEDEFELIPIFATELPQVQDDDTGTRNLSLVGRVRNLILLVLVLSFLVTRVE